MNIHPTMQSALQAFMPRGEQPTMKQISFRSPYVYEFRGNDADAVQHAAKVRARQIDPYASPAVSAQMKDAVTGETVVTLKYYAID